MGLDGNLQFAEDAESIASRLAELDALQPTASFVKYLFKNYKGTLVIELPSRVSPRPRNRTGNGTGRTVSG
jgi:hypothetical protein